MAGPPGLPVLAHEADEGLHLGLGDMLLQELAVVVQQGRDGVFSQDVIADLGLHHPKLLGDVLLGGKRAGVTGCSCAPPHCPTQPDRGLTPTKVGARERKPALCRSAYLHNTVIQREVCLYQSETAPGRDLVYLAGSAM